MQGGEARTIARMCRPCGRSLDMRGHTGSARRRPQTNGKDRLRRSSGSLACSSRLKKWHRPTRDPAAHGPRQLCRLPAEMAARWQTYCVLIASGENGPGGHLHGAIRSHRPQAGHQDAGQGGIRGLGNALRVRRTWLMRLSFASSKRSGVVTEEETGGRILP